MIAEEMNMNREGVRRILTEELGMRKICAKITTMRQPMQRSL
jgi:formate-dependent phosphoribosylglycinamide formyltransferase (GAR transformylase)